MKIKLTLGNIRSCIVKLNHQRLIQDHQVDHEDIMAELEEFGNVVEIDVTLSMLSGMGAKVKFDYKRCYVTVYNEMRNPFVDTYLTKLNKQLAHICSLVTYVEEV